MKLKSISGMLLIAMAIISCNKVDFKKTKGGLPYKLYPSKSGDSAKPGTIIKINYIQKIKDSVAFSSYETMPIYFQVTEQTNPYDISEIIPLLKEGDSVFIKQMMDTFIARNPTSVPPQFKKGDAITTSIKVLKVFKTQQEAMQDEEKEKGQIVTREDAAVKNYLSKNNINAQKVGSGIYVETLNPGTGEPITEGKYVTLNYTGKTFGGTTFDSNVDPQFNHVEPMSFVVGSPGMIKGFDEGVRALKEGGKARIYIPSMLAYGPQPPSPLIKPFEHLIFDIEVLTVEDKAPAQPNVPPANPQSQNSQGQ